MLFRDKGITIILIIKIDNWLLSILQPILTIAYIKLYEKPYLSIPFHDRAF